MPGQPLQGADLRTCDRHCSDGSQSLEDRGGGAGRGPPAGASGALPASGTANNAIPTLDLRVFSHKSDIDSPKKILETREITRKPSPRKRSPFFFFLHISFLFLQLKYARSCAEKFCFPAEGARGAPGATVIVPGHPHGGCAPRPADVPPQLVSSLSLASFTPVPSRLINNAATNIFGEKAIFP